MSKKLALITGGTGYLGAAVTNELVQRGFAVAALSRSSKEFPCDVTDALQVAAAVAKATERFGPVSFAIHAASAPIERVLPADASPHDTEAQTNVAVLGAKNLYEAVLPHMMEGGLFLAVTSDATKSTGKSKMGSYVKAKKEMEQYVSGLNAPFRTQLYSAGFLPGGLNKDLPEAVRGFLGSKSKSLDLVAKEIAERY